LPDAATVSVQEVFSGWGVPKLGERHIADKIALEQIGHNQNLRNILFECVQNLPDAVLALGLDARSVSIYWREAAAIPRAADEKERLNDGKSLLEELRNRLQTIALTLVEAYGRNSDNPG
jgi:hypothetical protein